MGPLLTRAPLLPLSARPNDNLAIKGANNVIVTVSFAILGNAVADGHGRGKEDEWKINGPNYRLSVPFTLSLA